MQANSGPATNHFKFVRGEDVEIDWTVYVSGADDAPAKDITGETLVFKVKRTDDDVDPSLVTATTALVIATDGTAKTTIAAAQMATLEEGDYRCSLWRTDAGHASCYSRGNFSVLGSVQDAV